MCVCKGGGGERREKQSEGECECVCVPAPRSPPPPEPCRDRDRRPCPRETVEGRVRRGCRGARSVALPHHALVQEISVQVSRYHSIMGDMTH